MVRDDNYVMCPLVVVNVIKNLLEFNDNSNNPVIFHIFLGLICDK